MALRPFHERGDGNTEPGRNRPAARTAENRRDNPFTQIIGKGSCHLVLASAQPARSSTTQANRESLPIHSSNETL
jgi:hypothetical protein